MNVKDGVILYGLHPKMQIANCIATRIWFEFNQTLVITEGVIIRATGFHPLGRACDYRTRYFDDAQEKRDVAVELQNALGNDYDVVLESDHIHCEYDPDNPKVI